MPMTPPSSSHDVDVDALETQIRAKLRRSKQRRLALVAVSVVAVVALTVALLISAQSPRPTQVAGDELPPGTDAETLGLVAGDGPVIIDEYFDFLCPSCRVTSAQIDPRLHDLVEDGAVTVRYHPLGKLDDYSDPPGYSTRAAAAAGCAAAEGVFEEFQSDLLRHQPPQDGPGFTDEELVQRAVALGADAESMAACVESSTYTSWVRAMTARAEVDAGVVATPTLLVDQAPVSVREDLVLQELDDHVAAAGADR